MTLKTFVRTVWFLKIALVVALAVVGLLYLGNILFPRHLHFWQGGRDDRARRAACRNNVREIGLAMIAYAQDHEMKYPETAGALLKEGYLPSARVFFCPSSRDECPEDLKGEPLSVDLSLLNQVETSGSYVLAVGRKHVGGGHSIIVFDKARNHAQDWIELGVGRNCCLDNGDARWLTEEDFERFMKQSP